MRTKYGTMTQADTNISRRKLWVNHFLTISSLRNFFKLFCAVSSFMHFVGIFEGKNSTFQFIKCQLKYCLKLFYIKAIRII